jgi:surface protein
MSGAFSLCPSLESLPDISKWSTENVINMDSIFRDDTKLKTLPDISKWNIKKCSCLSALFLNCSSLKKLPDISKWEIFINIDENKILEEYESLYNKIKF